MTLAWVIGRGGLLGSALERALRASGTPLFEPSRRFSWDARDRLSSEIALEVGRFAAAVGASGPWEIHWAAGIGTMGSEESTLATEIEALAALCDALEASTLCLSAGRFALASSAGAIYAGSHDPVISEESQERPTTAYARAKLAQEAIARAYVARSGTTLVIGRIATLYGAAQANAKQQGLLTHISRCVLRHRTVHIFVPLDTIRDYISADDAALMTIDALRAAESGRATMKIVASERPATISEILGIFKRLAHRAPLIVTSSTQASSLYQRRVQFRSVVPPLRSVQPGSLAIGIGRVLEAERLRYVRAAPGSSTA